MFNVQCCCLWIQLFNSMVSVMDQCAVNGLVLLFSRTEIRMTELRSLKVVTAVSKHMDLAKSQCGRFQQTPLSCCLCFSP